MLIPCPGLRKLKNVFLTHPDEDHINYAHDKLGNGLLDQQEIDAPPRTVNVYLGEEKGWESKKPDFLRALKSNNGVKVEFKTRDVMKSVQICEKTEIVMVASDLTETANGRSLVLSLKVNGHKKMLFMGDFEGIEGYKTLLSKQYQAQISDHEVIMVPHHGSGEKGNPNVNFYKLVKPKHAIVSSSLWADYRHPKLKHLKALCDYSTNWLANEEGTDASDEKKVFGWDVLTKQYKDGNWYTYSRLYSIDECQRHGQEHDGEVSFYQTTRARFEERDESNHDPVSKAYYLCETNIDGNGNIDVRSYEV